jgi:hypothetical protein
MKGHFRFVAAAAIVGPLMTVETPLAAFLFADGVVSEFSSVSLRETQSLTAPAF